MTVKVFLGAERARHKGLDKVNLGFWVIVRSLRTSPNMLPNGLETQQNR